MKALDPIKTKASKDTAEEIWQCLSYQDTFWIKSKYGRKAKTKTSSMLDRRNNTFPTGLLPIVCQYLKNKKIKYDLENNLETFPATSKPNLKGIKFRPDQLKSINRVIDLQRGLITAPTGSGKTIIALGIMSCFPKATILFLCHTLDILSQTAEALDKQSIRYCIIDSKSKDFTEENIVIATVQSFSKIPKEEYITYFDVTIIDECHRVSKIGQYKKIMDYNLAPVRIGLTATVPTDRKKMLMLYGILGPVIGELTMEEALEKKIIAKPKIKLVAVNKNREIVRKNYKTTYKLGVVENQHRNRLIIKEAIDQKKKGNTSLIIVKEIDHGKRLMEIGKKHLDIHFVQGKTEKTQRENLKKLLKRKQVDCVICTAVWREGTNIPSLDCIINACGGKSEIVTLQAVGRGLRAFKGKDQILIIDFLDPYRYLAEHTVQRLTIYRKAGWI
jgi:superfamily II DNA or RNA helicase